MPRSSSPASFLTAAHRSPRARAARAHRPPWTRPALCLWGFAPAVPPCLQLPPLTLLSGSSPFFQDPHEAPPPPSQECRSRQANFWHGEEFLRLVREGTNEIRALTRGRGRGPRGSAAWAQDGGAGWGLLGKALETALRP